MCGDKVAAARIADALPDVLAARTVAAIDVLLDDNVRWGPDDDGPETCYDRADVQQLYAGLLRSGLTVTVSETVVDGPRILAALSFTLDRAENPREPGDLFHVLTVRGGKIIEIHPADDRADAERRLRA